MIADAFPLDPPVEWFEELPSWFQPSMKATVITDGPEAGRFAGTVAQRGTFILNGGASKWTTTDSPSGYRDAMQGDTYTEDGTVVRTANLSADINHVNAAAAWHEAVDIMANTGTQIARVVYKDIPGYGTVALGAMWPGLSDLQVRKAQAAALSGDWRWREEYRAYDMTGSIFVNNPGLPLPARPVFQPLAMAASLSSEHPPILGAWQPQEINPMEPNQIIVCGGCGAPLPFGAQHMCVARPANAQVPFVAAAPAPPTNDQGAPTAPSADDRIAALEARMDAVESWLTDDAMSEMDGMAAALPEPVTPTPAT